MRGLILLIACQVVAAAVVMVLGRIWLQIDAEGGNSMPAGLIIGLAAILASIMLPLLFIRR